MIFVKTTKKEKQQIVQRAILAMLTAALLLFSTACGNGAASNPSASTANSSKADVINASVASSNTSTAQTDSTAAANCAPDSVQVPGSHGSYGEVDATFEAAVDTLVASGTSREEAIRQTLVAHAKNNVQRLAIWSFGLNLWADPNNTANLQKDGCLSPEGQALWQKYADAMSSATITIGNAPLDGIDSGVINDKYVVADHAGINGSTEAATVTLPNGVQEIVSKWCGNLVFMAVKPVIPKSSQITQHPMQQYVFVCDTVTKTDNVRVTVEEAANARYVAVGNIACKPQPPNVQRCDSKTGTDNVTISEELAKDTNRYKPVGNIACHPVEVIKACIKGSGNQTLKPVDKFDSDTMSTDIRDCVKPPCGCTPPPITRCDTHVWKIVSVTLERAKDTARYTDVSAEACKPPAPPVCDQKDHPKPHPTDVWDQDHCKWIPCPPPVTCPEGQTPNPNYPATSPDKCLEKKGGNFHTNPGVPPVVADPQPSAPGLDHTTTETGGRGGTVIDTPTNTNATAPSGVTAPGASAPNPTPPTQVNEGGATETNGTISGTVASTTIDAPTVVAPAAPAVVNNQAAQQAAAAQAAQEAAAVAATQAARAQAQVAVAPVAQVVAQQVATPAPAATHVATSTSATAQSAPTPTSAPTAVTTAAGAPVMATVTAPASNG